MGLNAGCASEAFTLHVRDLARRLVQRLPSDEHVRARSDPCVLEAVYLLVGFPERRARIWLGHRIATSFPTYTPLVPQRLRRIDKPTTAVSDLRITFVWLLTS
jgi:hypothetical protein